MVLSLDIMDLGLYCENTRDKAFFVLKKRKNLFGTGITETTSVLIVVLNGVGKGQVWLS